MADELDYRAVAVAGFMLTFAMAAKLEDKGLLTRSELNDAANEVNKGLAVFGLPDSVGKTAQALLWQMMGAARNGEDSAKS